MESIAQPSRQRYHPIKRAKVHPRSIEADLEVFQGLQMIASHCVEGPLSCATWGGRSSASHTDLPANLSISRYGQLTAVARMEFIMQVTN